MGTEREELFSHDDQEGGVGHAAAAAGSRGRRTNAPLKLDCPNGNSAVTP